MGSIADDLKSQIEARAVEVGIKSTSMAIREHIMAYYKGSTQRFVASSNVTIHRVNEHRGSYQYERREQENQVRHMIHLDGVPVLMVQKAPELVTFYSSFNRSPEFRAVKALIEDFLEEYLPNVKKEISDAHITTG